MTRVGPSPAPSGPRRNIRMMTRLPEWRAGLFAVVTLLTIGACAPRESGSSMPADRNSAVPAAAARPAAAAAPVSSLPRIVILGDSLTAGLGLR